MSDWQSVPLINIAKPGRENFIDGDWIEAQYITSEGVRLIQTGNVGVGEFKNKNKKFISLESFNELGCRDVYPGDLLICRLAEPAGRACIVPELEENKFITSVDVTIFRVNEDLFDKEYVHQSINTQKFLDRCQEVAGGTTRTRISRSNLGGLTLSCPPLQQQKKIVKILSTVDNLIEKTQTLIEKYTAIKQGMMADLFTRGIDMTTGPHCGKLRPSVEDAPELYKQTELGWVPKEWEVVLLDDISMRGSGHTPSKSFPEYWNGDIKWVSLADSKKLDDLYIHETDNNISELGLQNSSATKHPKGTVILSRDAGIGKSAILAEEMAVSQHFMAWRCGSALDNYFLYFWLQSMKPNFNAIAMGSTIPTIGLDYFKKLKISIPKDVDEQETIGKRVLKVFEKNVELKAEKKKYELIKKGLMQDLLTGKVKVA
jgi:type I restriction enzyme S subunit